MDKWSEVFCVQLKKSTEKEKNNKKKLTEKGRKFKNELRVLPSMCSNGNDTALVKLVQLHICFGIDIVFLQPNVVFTHCYHCWVFLAYERKKKLCLFIFHCICVRWVHRNVNEKLFSCFFFYCSSIGKVQRQKGQNIRIEFIHQ